MIILPAIDIIDGKPVRLYQGSYEKVREVAKDVFEAAKTFTEEGASWLHIVDLDGAKLGKPVNTKIILKVVRELKVFVQVGGGIRNMEQLDIYIQNGVKRCILGTSALKDRDFLKKAVLKHKDKIAVGIDAKNSKVSLEGWMEQSEKDFCQMGKEMEEMGVKTVIVTDILSDGTLQGVNFPMIKKFKEEVNVNIIASGGVKDIKDIEKLKKLDIYGVIAGSSLYNKTLNLKEANVLFLFLNCIAG